MTVYLSRTSLTVLVIATVIAIMGAMEHRAGALVRAAGARIEQEANR